MPTVLDPTTPGMPDYWDQCPQPFASVEAGLSAQTAAATLRQTARTARAPYEIPAPINVGAKNAAMIGQHMSFSESEDWGYSDLSTRTGFVA